MTKLLLTLYKMGIDTEISLKDMKYIVKFIDKNSNTIAVGSGDNEEEAIACLIKKLVVSQVEPFDGLSRL